MMEAVYGENAEPFPLRTRPFRDTLYASSTGDRLRVSTYESLKIPSFRSRCKKTFYTIISSESSDLDASIRRNSNFSRHSNYYEYPYPHRRYEFRNLRRCSTLPSPLLALDPANPVLTSNYPTCVPFQNFEKLASITNLPAFITLDFPDTRHRSDYPCRREYLKSPYSLSNPRLADSRKFSEYHKSPFFLVLQIPLDIRVLPIPFAIRVLSIPFAIRVPPIPFVIQFLPIPFTTLALPTLLVARPIHLILIGQLDLSQISIVFQNSFLN